MTSLIGGTRVRKNSLRLEAYGGVDELNAHLGMIRSYPLPSDADRQLIEIQRQLFVVGGNLATDPEKRQPATALQCRQEDVTVLEQAIDRMSEELPPLGGFVLPGGDPAVSACHIARTVCRRVERGVLALDEREPVDKVVLRYLNRLSDYLFVLSRWLARERGVTEYEWK